MVTDPHRSPSRALKARLPSSRQGQTHSSCTSNRSLVLQRRRRPSTRAEPTAIHLAVPVCPRTLARAPTGGHSTRTTRRLNPRLPVGAPTGTQSHKELVVRPWTTTSPTTCAQRWKLAAVLLSASRTWRASGDEDEELHRRDAMVVCALWPLCGSWRYGTRWPTPYCTSRMTHMTRSLFCCLRRKW